ncbi:ornithine carbamoyltransferase [Streptomyces sp. NPDC051561]|uniref:ornithine carbamoyltransferase n=1 Tax=Streptomyces sp. NPDC051561 TaxID=3365658 RepID=UPI00379C15FC
MRNFLSLNDICADEARELVDRAVEFARVGDRRAPRSLAGHPVGIYFSKTSTRTRSSFWAGATRLGADVITYGPDDLQLNTGETREDTARVLGQYLDALVIRTNGDVGEMRALGSSPDLAVVNALSLDEHPTQAVADFATLAEHFGDLDGKHLLYVGEGNSSAAALALLTALTPGFKLSVLCPEGYGLPPEILARVEQLGGGKALVTHHQHIDELDAPADAVYTARWQTMGVEKADPNWLRAFDGFRVDRDFFAKVTGPNAVFLHDLPAIRGQEVTDDMLDGPESLAWRQAYHKMTAAMSVLEWCVVGGAQ